MRPAIRLLPLALTLALSSIAAPAFAKTVYSTGDWSLDDSNPEDAKKGTCVAATATYLGNSGAYSLNVVVDKTGKRPLEVMIRPYKSPSRVSFFRVAVGNKAYEFGKLPRTAKGEDIFWQVPRGTEALIAEMKNSNQLNVQANGNFGELPFSMSGATATIGQLQKRCASNSLFTAVEFEKAFLPKEVTSLDITKLKTEQTGALRDIMLKAVEAYRGILKVKTELAALEARYAKLTQEKSTLIASLDQLANRDLPALERARDDAQNTVDRANVEIGELKAEIATQESLLASAKAAYEVAYDNLKPFIPEHDRLEDLMLSDQRRLGSAQSDLANVEAGIANRTQELANRNAEQDQLRSEQDRLLDEVRRARFRLADAESDLNRFDVQSEIRRRKQQDRRLDRLQDDLRDLQQNLRQQQNQLQDARQEKQQKAQALRACQGGGRASLQGLVDRVIAQAADDNNGRGGRGGRGGNGGGRGGDRDGDGERDGGGRGGRGGDNNGGGGRDGNRPNPPTPPAPNPPTPPSPPPAPDCSRQKNELEQAERRLDNAQDAVNRTQNAIQSKDNERDQIVRNIENDVQRQRDELAQREAGARRHLAALESRRDQVDTRLRDVTQYEIPRLQNELANLRSQRSQLEGDVSDASRALSRSTSDYQAYKRSVNYDALKAEVNRTAAKVSSIKSEISGLHANVARNERIVREQTAIRDNLDKRIVSTKETISQKTARLAQVNKLLEPYDAEKGEVMVRLSAAQQTLADISREFAALLPSR